MVQLPVESVWVEQQIYLVDLEGDRFQTLVVVVVVVLDLPLLLIAGVLLVIMERNLQMYQVYLPCYQL